MKILATVVFAMFLTGGETAIASAVSYEFAFQFPQAGTTSIAYVAPGPTLPGTNLNDLLGSMSPTTGFRDTAGAWSFTRGSQITSFTFIAQTDTTFANLPGLYSGLPALFVTRFGLSTPGTVDITIETVPEPGTWLLIAVGFAALCGGRVKPARQPFSRGNRSSAARASLAS